MKITHIFKPIQLSKSVVTSFNWEHQLDLIDNFDLVKEFSSISKSLEGSYLFFTLNEERKANAIIKKRGETSVINFYINYSLFLIFIILLIVLIYLFFKNKKSSELTPQNPPISNGVLIPVRNQHKLRFRQRKKKQETHETLQLAPPPSLQRKLEPSFKSSDSQEEKSSKPKTASSKVSIYRKLEQ